MFRIGEFSKIAQVSGRLLRYYDELGLLSPTYTDSQTGYRYYSADQLPDLNRILVLKELGLSLDQIAQVLKRHASIDEIRGMLTLRRAQVEQSLQEEMVRLRMIESRLEQIDVHGMILEPDVVLKTVPALRILSVRAILPEMRAVQRRVQTVFARIPEYVVPAHLSQLMVLVHSPIYDPAAYDVEIGFELIGDAPHSVRLLEDCILTQRDLDAVEHMATLVHVGRVTESHQGYIALAIWLDHNGWQLAGTAREILIQLPRPGPDDDAVMELQLPVRRQPVP